MYVFSFYRLIRINVFLLSQHGIRAIKEFESTMVRVSPCGQFRQPIQRPCHNPAVLQSSRSLTEAKPSSKNLVAGNVYRRDFPVTSIPTEEHTNRSASLRSTFRWKPRRKIASHSPISDPAREARDGACNTVFTCASSSRWCVCRRQAIPSTPRAPPSPEKPFFSVLLSVHCYCVFLSPESPLFLCFLELYNILRALGVVSVDSY